MLKIRKRSGEEVLFDRSKIERAIEKANASVSIPERLDRDIIAGIALSIENACSNMKTIPTVSISSAPVYDLLCLVENNASDDEDLSRAIRASRHIRNLFPDVEVIQKMRLSRQRTEQIVVDYLFENTDFR